MVILMIGKANSIFHYIKSYRFSSLFISNLIIILLLIIGPIITMGVILYQKSNSFIHRIISV